jgi:hypothetical protein
MNLRYLVAGSINSLYESFREVIFLNMMLLNSNVEYKTFAGRKGKKAVGRCV